MASRQLEQWRRLFEQKRQQLLEEDCATALQVESFEELQHYLAELTATYSRATFPGILERLQPGLIHVGSFTAAITSASQYSPVACLVWGSIQAVMQCAYASNDMLDEVVEVMAEINDSMPLFESYLALFPHCLELQYPLQDIFDVYVDFCLDVIAYLKRSGSVNFLLFFWTSKPKTLAENTRTKIRKHFNTFHRAAELAHRRRTHLQHLKIEETLASNPLQNAENEAPQRGDSDDHYPVSTVHMFRNYSFQGREDVFEQIREIFATPLTETARPSTNGASGQRQALPEVPACCVLHGLGGIGKTQTALEYTYRSRDEYDAILWIPAEQNAALSGEYTALADKLHLTANKNEGSGSGESQGQAVKKVFEWLKTTRRKWLIVFDNVEDINDLHAYLPTKTSVRGHVILTTQHPDFFAITDIFKLVKLRNFDRDEGSNLLFAHLQRQPQDDDEAEFGKQISDTQDGLPLAIATIGGYINASECSVEDFLADMETSSNAWEAGSIGQVRQYEKNLQTVFRMALQELPEKARTFVNILAFLSPDSIPEDLFLSDTSNKSSYSRAELTEVMRILRRRQLIRRDTSGPDPFISIHRTVQWNVLLDLSRGIDHRWRMFKKAFDLVCHKLPEVSAADNPEPDKWLQFEKYVPQILSLRTHCLWPEPPVELPEEFVQVLSDMATFMWHAGLMNQGYDALMTAEHILDDNEAPIENPLRGNIHEHIAIITSFNGVSQRKEAMDRRHKAIEARRAYHDTIPRNRVTFEDEIRLYNVESDMAYGLLQGENFEEAEKYIEKCHTQYQKWGTPEEIPFEYLKYNHIMSYIRMSQQKPVAAVKHCKDAAKLGEQCAGVEHPITQNCRFGLANHLYLAGEPQKALDLSDSVLDIRAKVCGEFNRFTLESHALCAYLRLLNNEPEKASVHLAKCLDRRKRPNWNPEGVARAQYIYSLALDRLDQPEESAKLRKEAIAVRDRYLRLYPEWVTPNPDNLVVFDQMVCLWAGRFSGALSQDGVSSQDDLYDSG